MSDFDRKLVDLIADVTGGEVMELRYLVEEYGTTPVLRVIADGFGAVFLVRGFDLDYHEAVESALPECRFLPTEDALTLVRRSPISSDYKIHQAPGAFDLEDEPSLLFRYAADEPEAIAEVRRRHAERREPAERERRQLKKLMRRRS